MRPGTDDAPLRERVRKNVGRLRPGIALWPGLNVPGRFGTIFDGTDLVSGAVTIPGPDGTPVIIPAPPPDSLPDGRIIGAYITLASGNRSVKVTTTLPAPCVIRALTLHGSLGVDQAVSFRVLLSQDDDTTATATPTGTDLIEFSGDVVGAEDVGVHANLAVGDLTVEPWRKVLVSGQRLKLKLHNVAGGVRSILLCADLDMLA